MRAAEHAPLPGGLFLHGVWARSRLHLWGERPAANHVHDAPPRRAGPATSPRHPRACSVAELHDRVGELIADGLLASAVDESTLDLWLPASPAGPAPSATNGGCAATTILGRYSVPTLAFGPADAIDLLSTLSAQWLAAGTPSLRYWRRLAAFVLSLLARQQFVPDLEERADGSFAANWRPCVCDRRELTWLEAFVAAMPPVCRAVAGLPATDREPTQLVESFLGETADAIIRRSLSRDDFFDDIHDRAAREGGWELCWISGLLGRKNVVAGSREDNALLAGQVRAWISQLAEGMAEGPPRLTLRLVEPREAVSAADPAWRVEFELRAADDGRLLDVRAVWAEPPQGATVLGQRLLTRREHLLSELGRAGQVCPPLARALAEPSPTGLRLDTNEAHAFLRDHAPLLAAQGIDVELPEWVRQSDRRMGLQLRVRPAADGPSDPSLGSLGLTALVDFDWRVAVGDAHLTLDEFERLTAQNAPLVRLDDRWISIDHAAAGAAVEFMRSRPAGRMTLLQAMRLAGGADEMEAGLPVVGISGTDWIEQFLRETPEFVMEPVPQPGAFVGLLRPYQLRGLSWLAFLDRLGIGACLADDMGLGKTIQLIALLLNERIAPGAAGARPGPTLLFAPMSLVGNWQREIERFAPSLRALVFHGPLRLGGEAFADAAAAHDVIITTYGLAARELRTLQRVAWHRVALDEAQKIKNPSAHQTIALRSIHALHKVALTGTPVENHLSELWSIMEVLNPGLLGSAAAFRARFAVPIEKLGDAERAGQLRRLIRPFMLRRLKSDPAVACDLPDKMEMRVFCNLTAEQAAHYERTVSQMLNEVDSASGIRRRGLILAALTRLKQICNHPVHFLGGSGPLDGRSGKCERLVEMLEEVVEEGDAALVFTQYREMGELLVRLLSTRLGQAILFLHGGTTMKKRNEMIQRFQDTASPERIFLLSLKAGGFGLNLTRANHVFHFDRWWNPAVEEQATDRAHRIGQTRQVQVHKFVCIGTVEDRIDRLLTEKSALAANIVGSGDEWLTGLSTLELRQYLALGDEAVAEAD
jgi:non-specific serine/threonine protein kinase